MIGNFLRGLSDAERPGSLSNRMRARRFQHFLRLTEKLPRPITILDVGGTVDFWLQRGWADREDVEITLLNMAQPERTHEGIRFVQGDATNLSEFADNSYAVVFSNSVIEHLFDKGNQEKMAKEAMRVGRDYWIQTPNRWFPIEPHFQVPFWQFLPVTLRVRLIMRHRFGRRGPCGSLAEAEELVKEIRLLTGRELRELFPDGELLPERFLGLVKSWTVHSRFGTTRNDVGPE